MDLFLGHLASHIVPGRNLTWYASFLVCLAVYLIVVDQRTPVVDDNGR